MGCTYKLICRFSLKPSRVKLSRSTLNLRTQSTMLKPKFKTRRESHRISSVSFLLESSSRMDAPFLTTTFRRKALSTLYFGFVEVERRGRRRFTPNHRKRSVFTKRSLFRLKYYRVEDGGKVVRLRKYSPVAGVGCFMAQHHDRYYCGKSGTPFLYDDMKE